MTHEEYDHDRDLEEARFSWYLGLLVLAFFIFMECVFTLAARYEWSAESGLTKAQFAKAVIIKLLKDAVRSHEGNIATQQANEATNAAVDAEIVLS